MVFYRPNQKDFYACMLRIEIIHDLYGSMANR